MIKPGSLNGRAYSGRFYYCVLVIGEGKENMKEGNYPLFY